MIKQKKVPIAYRFKAKTSSSIKSLIFYLFLGTLALAMGIFLLFIKPEEGQLGYKIVLVSLMFGGAIFCFALIPMFISLKKRIKINNIYFFENEYSMYEADVIINNKDVTFTFDASNDNREDCLSILRLIMKNFQSIYEKTLDAVVKQMYDTAVDWNEDNEDLNIAEFTPDKFRDIISNYSITVLIGNEDYSFSFIDTSGELSTDLFIGHSIQCDCNTNNDEIYVSLQG